MAELGLAATEFGPDGFLPADPAEQGAAACRHGLPAVGGFVPVVLHDPAHDPLPRGRGGRCDGLVAAGAGDAGAGRGDRAGGVRRPAGARRRRLDAPARQPRPARRARPPSAASPRRCTRTSARWSRTAPRSTGCWPAAAIGLCLDTGHLLIGGADPVRLAREHARADRARPPQGRRRRPGPRRCGPARSPTPTAVATGMYLPLGAGRRRHRGDRRRPWRTRGYAGWYVLEQDTVLPDRPTASGGAVAATSAPASAALPVTGWRCVAGTLTAVRPDDDRARRRRPLPAADRCRAGGRRDVPQVPRRQRRPTSRSPRPGTGGAPR